MKCEDRARLPKGYFRRRECLRDWCRTSTLDRGRTVTDDDEERAVPKTGLVREVSAFLSFSVTHFLLWQFRNVTSDYPLDVHAFHEMHAPRFPPFLPLASRSVPNSPVPARRGRSVKSCDLLKLETRACADVNVQCPTSQKVARWRRLTNPPGRQLFVFCASFGETFVST